MSKEVESLKAELMALVESFSTAAGGCQKKASELKNGTPIGLSRAEAKIESNYQAGKVVAFSQCARQLKELADQL